VETYIKLIIEGLFGIFNNLLYIYISSINCIGLTCQKKKNFFFFFTYSFRPSILYLIYVSLKYRALDLRNHFNYVNLKKKLNYASMGKN
jgi:hypothetical protein